MTANELGSVTRFIRRILAPKGAAEAEDGRLLRQFSDRRDEAAFAALVRRHGPMVFGVCRRILCHAQDAEDAFQATFLVLARKAGSISRPALLGNWLYGVACRTSLKARAETARRRRRETAPGDHLLTAAAADIAPDDLGRVIDEEVRKLPEKYRRPFVLCYLEGRTNEEAARILGRPKGTILSRLAWARERLRSRLTRRGVAPGAAPLAALSALDAPAAFVDSTVRGVLSLAAGKAAGADAVSATAVALAEGVVRTMFLNKLKTAAVAAALAAALAGALACYALAPKPPAEPKPPANPAAPAAFGFEKLPLTADDVVAATGLNVYKFRLDIPKDDKFRVAWTELPAEGAEGKVRQYFDFQRDDTDGPITVRVHFLGKNGEIKGVLLSDEEEFQYSIRCDGCRGPSGMGTILPNPMSGLPANERIMGVMSSDKDEGTIRPGLIRLLAVCRFHPPKPLHDFASGYPRVELTVERNPAP